MILTEKNPEGKRDSQEPTTIPSSWTQSLEALSTSVLEAAAQGLAVHEVEQQIWDQMLALGREALSLFFQQQGTGDLGEELELDDGRVVRRLPQVRTRAYQSIFGTFHLSRHAYGTREGQKIELVPLDQRLQLPEGKFSNLLQDWNQHLAVETPFSQVSQILEKILGFKQSVDSLERGNRKMAGSVVDFLDALPAPLAEEEGELLVASADGKGVPIRRPQDAAPIERHKSKSGPLPDRKKIALLGASYTVDRNPRTPEEVVASLFRKPDADNDNPPRPEISHKRLRSSLARSDSGTTQPAVEEIFGWLALEANERNADADKPYILLMDGQRSLWDAASEHLREDRIEILDLLHVTPRLWKAAHIFHPKESAGATRFVKERLLRILRGQTNSVVRGLRRMATVSGIKGRKRSKLERICRYLKNNAQRMLYHEYLAAGYPIATGVIEGACRHLVKDRLEQTGMQWGMPGAQAMLDLRSVHLTQHWGEFQAYRVANENRRLYLHRDLVGRVEWPLAA